VKLDRLSVYPVWQHPVFVIISTQPQLLLLISGHPLCSPRANHTKASIFGSIDAAVQRSLETLQSDGVLPLRHAVPAELLFFAVLFINIVAFQAERNHPAAFTFEF